MLGEDSEEYCSLGSWIAGQSSTLYVNETNLGHGSLRMRLKVVWESD